MSNDRTPVCRPVYCIVFYHSVEHFFGCLLHYTATSVIIPSDI